MKDKQNAASEKSGAKEYIITFIIGAVVGAFLMWLGIIGFTDVQTQEDVRHDVEIKGDVDTDALHSRTPLSTDDLPVSEGNEFLIIPDQETGGEVFVQQVSLTQPGWVVVHELSDDGLLGNALGAQRFNSGTYSGAVSLLRVTEVENEYVAVLYRDNGDKRFDLDLDLPVLDTHQEIIQARFVAL